jgi:hypothetical protein
MTYTRHAGNAVDHNKAVEELSKAYKGERVIEARMADIEKRVEALLRKKWRLVEKLAAAMNASERGLLADSIKNIIELDHHERRLVARAKKRKQRAEQQRPGGGQTLPRQAFVFDQMYRGVRIKANTQRGIDVMKRMHDEMAKTGGIQTAEGGWIR